MGRVQSIGKAVSFMERNLKEPVAIEDIARISGFSKSTLQRRFIEITNVTVALFLRRLRLNAAADELVATKRRILDIALDYQFESQQTFTRAFKQATWLTPGEVRRMKRVPSFGELGNESVLVPSASRLLTLRGAMIFTENVDTLREFYHEVLGFSIVGEDSGFVQLDMGGAILALHSGLRSGVVGKRAAVEISFYAEDVERTRKELILRGAKVESVALLGELRLCKGFDPDGNIFGISNRPLGNFNNRSLLTSDSLNL